MSAAAIALALGGTAGTGWCRAPCPVHGSRGDTLGLKDGPRGLILKCHAGCDRADILAQLERLGLLGGGHAAGPPPDPVEIERRREEEERKQREKLASAMDTWRESESARDTLVEDYLLSRDIWMPPPPSIRLVRSMFHKESGARRPARIALMEHVEKGPTGLLITYLDPFGTGKASLRPNKRMRGGFVGSSVHLEPAGPVLAIGEGIETSMSVWQEISIPTWSTLCAEGMASLVLPPLPLAAVVHVFADNDNDKGGAGETAARKAGDRWLAEGRRVTFTMPPTAGEDFNDVLRNRGKR